LEWDEGVRGGVGEESESERESVRVGDESERESERRE